MHITKIISKDIVRNIMYGEHSKIDKQSGFKAICYTKTSGQYGLSRIATLENVFGMKRNAGNSSSGEEVIFKFIEETQALGISFILDEDKETKIPVVERFPLNRPPQIGDILLVKEHIPPNVRCGLGTGMLKHQGHAMTISFVGVTTVGEETFCFEGDGFSWCYDMCDCRLSSLNTNPEYELPVFPTFTELKAQKETEIAFNNLKYAITITDRITCASNINTYEYVYPLTFDGYKQCVSDISYEFNMFCTNIGLENMDFYPYTYAWVPCSNILGITSGSVIRLKDETSLYNLMPSAECRRFANSVHVVSKVDEYNHMIITDELYNFILSKIQGILVRSPSIISLIE